MFAVFHGKVSLRRRSADTGESRQQSQAQSGAGVLLATLSQINTYSRLES
jgi:hypothetical protein